MAQNKLALPKIVSRDEWLAARKELLEKEKEITRARDKLNAERRRLPMVEIKKEYVFESPDGKASLLDLFEGRRQLILYHFMFEPDRDEGCGGCSMVVDNMCHPAHVETSLASPGWRKLGDPARRRPERHGGGKRAPARVNKRNKRNLKRRQEHDTSPG